MNREHYPTGPTICVCGRRIIAAVCKNCGRFCRWDEGEEPNECWACMEKREIQQMATDIVANADRISDRDLLATAAAVDLRRRTPEERETYYVAKIVRLEKVLAAAKRVSKEFDDRIGSVTGEAMFELDQAIAAEKTRAAGEPECYLCSSRDDLRHFGTNGREIHLCTMCLSHGGTRDWMGAR